MDTFNIWADLPHTHCFAPDLGKASRSLADCTRRCQVEAECEAVVIDDEDGVCFTRTKVDVLRCKTDLRYHTRIITKRLHAPTMQVSTIAEPCGLGLVRQWSRSPCIANVTFGCGDHNRLIWFCGGCRGVFSVRGSTGSFDSEDGDPTPTTDGSLSSMAFYCHDPAVEGQRIGGATIARSVTRSGQRKCGKGGTRWCEARGLHSSSDSPRGVRLAVVFVFATPRTINRARATWLADERTPYVALGDADDATHHIHYEPDQTQLSAYQWAADNNHAADNRPLAAVHLANLTLSFDWLMVADADTSFNLDRVRMALWALTRHEVTDSTLNEPQHEQRDTGATASTGGEGRVGFFGFRHPPGGRRGCTHGRRLAAASSRPLRTTARLSDGAGTCPSDAAAIMQQKNWSAPPPLWPYGGGGYLISRRLLSRISTRQWAECQRRLVHWGGDVRVAKCIFRHTGELVTHLPGMGVTLSRHAARHGMLLTG